MERSVLRNRLACAVVALISGVNGGCSIFFNRCEALPEASLAALPTRISSSGLYADARLTVTSERARSFEPAFPLWSDGAAKRRWITLPAGARIDTSNMDDWVFPEGTRVWKEFSRNGQRLETRLLVKVGPAPRDWAGASYVWLDDGSDALLALDGAEDIAGTDHDAPSAKECPACHAGRNSFVLGFSAIQLAESRANTTISLDSLVREGVLSNPPRQRLAVPGTPTERAALGYLHANCGSCHNQRRPASDGPRCYDPRRKIDFWLQTEQLAAVASTPTYRTVIPDYITPAQPDDSRVISVASQRGIFLHMPPLASEHVDDAGVALLRRWIAEMPASARH
jgi:hypothetical protein